MTVVPVQYQAMVNQAALDSGVPVNVVIAQINLESGFNPTARSSAGAEGIAQFLPSTFASYGTGSPYNPADAFKAYAAFMKHLLAEFNGNLRDALAAYNAGPGNIQAGMGYANKILAAASVSGVGNLFGNPVVGPNGVVGGGPSNVTTNGQQALGTFGNIVTDIGSAGLTGINGVTNAIGGIVKDVSTGLNMFSLLFRPSFWLRVGAFVAGVILFIIGGITLKGAT